MMTRKQLLKVLHLTCATIGLLEQRGPSDAEKVREASRRFEPIRMALSKHLDEEDAREYGLREFKLREKKSRQRSRSSAIERNGKPAQR
jgi:hypothetical protein